MTHVELKNFEDELTKIAAEIEGTSPKILKAAAFSLFADLITKTPVDTGYARFNWQLSVNTPKLEPKPKKPGHKTGNKNLYPLPNMAPNIGKVEVGDSIYITNNVNYMKLLNEGHSSQAPVINGRGFIEMSLHEMLTGFRG